MTMRLRLSRSDLLNISGISYRPVETEVDGIVLERADQPGITQGFTYDEVFELLKSPGCRYQPGYFDFTRSRQQRNTPVDLISELDDEARSDLLWRMAICKAARMLE